MTSWNPPYIPIISYAVIFNNIHWSWNIHSHWFDPNGYPLYMTHLEDFFCPGSRGAPTAGYVFQLMAMRDSDVTKIQGKDLMISDDRHETLLILNMLHPVHDLLRNDHSFIEPWNVIHESILNPSYPAHLVVCVSYLSLPPALGESSHTKKGSVETVETENSWRVYDGKCHWNGRFEGHPPIWETST